MPIRMRSLFGGLVALALAAAGLTAHPSPAHAAPAPVCALSCDTLDPSKAKQDTFPVADRVINGRLLRLHVSDPDSMAWAGIDRATQGDAVWLDRSWDRGATWEPLLGKATVPGTWILDPGADALGGPARPPRRGRPLDGRRPARGPP
ncbi:hypothetical protein ACWDN9_10510, partial [Streptomyces nigra]